MSVIPNHLVDVSSAYNSPTADDTLRLLERIETSSLAQIGNTPLISLNDLAPHVPESVSIYGKAEHLNPSGSVKDRAALNIIKEAIKSGHLNKDVTLIDSTSGNTGIAYAMIGAALGIRVEIAMPESASEERKRMLRSYGAILRLTDANLGSDGAQQYVLKKMASNPKGYFYANQYNNDANWLAHFEGTGPELIDQTNAEITHFVAGVGTTGTFVGTARRLKAFNPGIMCISVQPNKPKHGLKGLRHLESAMVPGIYDHDLVDVGFTCSTENACEMSKRMAREQGLLVGISTGANVFAAIKLAEQLDSGYIVTVLNDSGNRYLSHEMWA